MAAGAVEIMNSRIAKNIDLVKMKLGVKEWCPAFPQK